MNKDFTDADLASQNAAGAPGRVASAGSREARGSARLAGGSRGARSASGLARGRREHAPLLPPVATTKSVSGRRPCSRGAERPRRRTAALEVSAASADDPRPCFPPSGSPCGHTRSGCAQRGERKATLSPRADARRLHLLGPVAPSRTSRERRGRGGYRDPKWSPNHGPTFAPTAGARAGALAAGAIRGRAERTSTTASGRGGTRPPDPGEARGADSVGGFAQGIQGSPPVVDAGPRTLSLQINPGDQAAGRRSNTANDHDFSVDSGILCVARRKKTEIKFSPQFCCAENEICPLRTCVDDPVFKG